jgi:hypothetical protein
MADPKEIERRRTEFDPERLEEHGRTVNEALSSKRINPEPGHVEKAPRSTRIGRPGSRRSGSDSNAGRRTRGH